MLNSVIFKANDIRGLVTGPDVQWDAEGARLLGAAWVDVLGLTGGADGSDRLVIGHDMRTTSPELQAAFVTGVTSRGVDVVDIGLASTDLLWFASGHLDLPGVMFTASHNPGDWNGIKFCLAGAAPVTSDHLASLQQRVAASTPTGSGGGTVTEQDLLPAYTAHMHSLVNLTGIRRLKVVADAGNGMAGHTLPSVFADIDAELIGLYTDPDGSFPNHQPNPLEPENLVDAQRAVREHGADLGLVFDGDADRCFIIDERGEVVNPSTLTALIAGQELRREPGAAVVINTITSRAVAEIVAEQGGRIVVSKVGHTYIKAAMAEHDAIFGGEHSAHYYFRDFWRADTGMLAALHAMALLGHQSEPLSTVVQDFTRYAASGEINSTVSNAAACMDAVAAEFADHDQDRADGLTVRGPDWWVNLRPSNTEPLLRLNVEAPTTEAVEQLRDRVLAIVRAEG
ncbi:phosphomannomutase/phosphoglucomutase [Propionibacteriaceae bacterium Y1700]|uniref:phosphomannomutase/phosphoglucomutase n=1 Tax=Microlunatus sp. Y1700 TaxID=3418487 RepID=UPI003DA6E1CC